MAATITVAAPYTTNWDMTIATRYEKRAVNYLAMVHLGMLLSWL